MPDYQQPDDSDEHVHPFFRENAHEASSSDLEHDLVEFHFTNHPPAGPHIIERFERLREAAKHMAHEMIECIPMAASTEADYERAMTNLRQALMWSVSAIACNQHLMEDEIDG